MSSTHSVTPPSLHRSRLTLDLAFNHSWSLDVPPSASSAMSYTTAPTSAPSPLPSPGEDDGFRVPAVDSSPPLNTEPPLTFTVPESDRAGPSSQSIDAYRDSSGSSSTDSDLTVLLRPTFSLGFAQGNPPSHGIPQQRYLRSAVPTPYYTAHSTPEPERIDDRPQAGPSRLPVLDTNITLPTILSAHPPTPRSVTLPPFSRDSLSARPPSPTPTADFSMISPPSSPTYYLSQLADDPDVDTFRSSHIRATATLPFLRSNATSVAGSFHFPVNTRSQSMSPSMGLGPLMAKHKRARPGISRLWESIASPAKASPQHSSMPQDPQRSPIPAVRTKSSPMPGFSVVRNKTSPMMGVRRKLKERHRIKRVRRGMHEADTDVDYGALDPLDGEEGELVGCTCTGWGDGACVCGYGYWDANNYGHTQEPECTRDGGQHSLSAPTVPSVLTRPFNISPEGPDTPYPASPRAFSPGSFLSITMQHHRRFIDLQSMAFPRTRQWRLVGLMEGTTRRSSCTQSPLQSMLRIWPPRPRLLWWLRTPISGCQG